MFKLFSLRLISSILLAFLALGCEGPQGDAGPTGPAGPQGNPGDSDKQLRFGLAGNIGISSTTPFMHPEVWSLMKFNVHNYTGIDSVVFYALIKSENSSTNCIVDLYNWTDDEVIPVSELMSSSTTLIWINSGNLFNELPNKEISLSPRIRSETNSV
jgi:hypothetical protein